MNDEPEDQQPAVEAAATGRALAPMFTPGGRPGPGRPRGRSNRTTTAMKEAIAAVFQDLQATHEGEGEYPHFFEWAKGHPTEFYRMAARLLPLQVEAGAAATIGVVVFQGIND